MGWIIFFSVIGLFIILLLLSLKITLSIDKKVYFKVSFFLFTLYKFDGKNKKSSSYGVKKSKSENKSVIDILKKYVSDKNKLELIKEIFFYLKLVLEKFKELLKHTRFSDVVLDLTVATDNASDTALLYGKLSSIIYPVLSLVDNSMKFTPKKLSVRTDFTATEMTFNLSGTLKVRLIYILGFLLSTFWSITKFKIGEKYNGK
jgi:hypothetical protein